MAHSAHSHPEPDEADEGQPRVTGDLEAALAWAAAGVCVLQQSLPYPFRDVLRYADTDTDKGPARRVLFAYVQEDENTTSATTPWCSFTVDKKGPVSRVTVTREDGKSFATTDHKARTPLRLKLYNPAGDLGGFCWRMDRLISASGTPCAGGNWIPLANGVKGAVIEVVPTGGEEISSTRPARAPWTGRESGTSRVTSTAMVTSTRSPRSGSSNASPR